MKSKAMLDHFDHVYRKVALQITGAQLAKPL